MSWLSPLLLAAGLQVAAPASDTLRAVLVRHGHAYSNVKPTPKMAPNELDRLTDLGQAEAESACAALQGHGVRFVLASPMGRTRATAERIRQGLGLPAVTVEPRLRPMDMGVDPSGQPLEIDARWAEWKMGRDPTPPQGESLDGSAGRVLDLLREQRAAQGPGTIVFVTHSEVIASVVGRLQGVPAPERFPPNVPNCSLTVVDVPPDGEPRLVAEPWKPALTRAPTAAR